MTIEFACAACGKQFKVDAQMAGKRGKCKACGTVNTVPAAQNAPPALDAPSTRVQAPVVTKAAAPARSGAVVPPPMPAKAPAARVPAPPPGVPVPPPLPKSATRPALAPVPPPVMAAASAQGCPACGAPMGPAAVFCTNCGFDKRTGARVSAAAPTTLAATPRRGLQTWQIVLITCLAALLIIGVGVGIFVRNIVRAINQSPSFASLNTSANAGPFVPAFPELPPPLKTANGTVEVYPMTIGGTGPGLPMRIKLYLPAGPRTPRSLPCVFIAPAGTRLLHGSAIDDDVNDPEHLPYARQGFAVVNYELSGDVPGDTHGGIPLARLAAPVSQFMAADGGLANAHAAIEFVLAKVPAVDPTRLYAAGHSSAAVVALDLAAGDHRIRAVAAYAPACDVVARWGGDLNTMNRLVPGASDLAARVSPIRHVDEFNCPIYLFHANDDTNVSMPDNRAFADALRSAGKSVQFVNVPRGGHYQSMIQQGIPGGIAFFRSQGANPVAPTSSPNSAVRTPGFPNVPSPRFPQRLPQGVETPEETAPGKSWEPDAAQLDKLAPETTYEGYAFRPPAGFVQLETKPADHCQVWQAKGVLGVQFSVRVEPRVERRRTRPFILTGNGTSPPGVNQTLALMGATLDYGTIAGIPFTRATRELGNQKTVIYTAFEGDHYLLLSASAADDATSAMLESAVRTLHKQ
ncbi:MAG: Alpha/beta hydrolase family protein [Phycisphaerales bacterium]|nr:Alpha/beta hydrolase family protein [Phycisphaerales bacterium]